VRGIDEADDGKAEPADLHERMQEFLGIKWRANEVADRVGGKDRHASHGCQAAQHQPTERGDGFQKAHCVPPEYWRV
jgi:hypothetical protein